MTAHDLHVRSAFVTVGAHADTVRLEYHGGTPSGRTINVGIGDYLRFDNGLVVEHRGVMDTGALMQQLTGD